MRKIRLIHGVRLTICRILRCTPWSKIGSNQLRNLFIHNINTYRYIQTS